MNNWDEVIEELELQLATRCSVTSWYRSATRNQSVGGIAHSLHLTGEAVDLVWDGPPPPAEEVQRHARRFGLHLVREPDHDHLERVRP